VHDFILEKIKDKDIVALVGAGGKTTTMMQLANHLKNLNMRVMVTTTTRIFVPELAFYDLLTMQKDLEYQKPLIGPGTITVIGNGIEEPNKLIGVDPEWLDKIASEKWFDVILVEADGSKRKPIKAPASHEPVIPKDASCVIGVIGLDALGKPLSNEWVHRLTEFKTITHAAEGDLINEEMLMNLIVHPEGLFKKTPSIAEKIVLLNKAETTMHLITANNIKSLLKGTEINVFVRSRHG